MKSSRILTAGHMSQYISRKSREQIYDSVHKKSYPNLFL